MSDTKRAIMHLNPIVWNMVNELNMPHMAVCEALQALADAVDEDFDRLVADRDE